MALIAERVVSAAGVWRNIVRRIPPGSKLYYPGLDYGTWYTDTILDYSGNANNGTRTGAATAVLPSGLPYLDFDALDDIVTVTDAASIQNIFDGGGTIRVWIRPDTDGEGDYGRIFDKEDGINKLGWSLIVQVEVAGKLEVAFTQQFSTARGSWSSTATVLDIAKWGYVAITYNNGAVGNNPIIYVGTSTGLSTLTVGSGLTEDVIPVGTRGSDATVNLSIGNDAATTRTFDGGITQELLIPATIWTAAQVESDFQQTRRLAGV